MSSGQGPTAYLESAVQLRAPHSKPRSPGSICNDRQQADSVGTRSVGVHAVICCHLSTEQAAFSSLGGLPFGVGPGDAIVACQASLSPGWKMLMDSLLLV